MEPRAVPAEPGGKTRFFLGPERPSAIRLPMTLAVCVLAGRTRGPFADEPIFVESAAATGLAFTHVNGATGSYYLPEVMGAGVALFDYDNDGDLDVFLVQGGALGRTAIGGPPQCPPFPHGPPANPSRHRT